MQRMVSCSLLLLLLLLLLAGAADGVGSRGGRHASYGPRGGGGGGGGGGFDAAALGRSHFHGGVRPPTLKSLHPPKAHVAGGTHLSIHGGGFRRGPGLAVRFAVENEFAEVPATFISKTHIECVTPQRHGVHTAHVTATNGDGAWSGHPLNFVHGSGTFLSLTFDNSNPGCPGCNYGGFQASAPAGGLTLVPSPLISSSFI